MAIPRPSYKELVDRIYTSITRQTTISQPLESSVVGLIVKVCAAELDIAWAQLEDIARQASLTTATGAGLDNWGQIIGVPRKLATKASTLGYTRSLRFINNGAGAVSISSNTRVWKSSNPQVAFFTSEGISLNPGQQGEVHVIAADNGEIFNAATGEIDKHNIPNVNIVVTNILPITNGSQRESDSSYRERLLQEYRRRVVFNKDTAAAMLRGVPGVQDVLIDERVRGPGSYDAIIVPYSVTEISSVISNCQTLLAEYSPVGLSALAKGPVYKNLDIVVKIRFAQNTEDSNEAVRQRIRDQIQSLVSVLPIEDGTQRGTLFLPQIKGIALSGGPSVLDANVQIGLDGTPVSTEGELRLSKGERFVVRGLSVI